ncbi:MAG: hypothetical protein ABIW03_03920 [Sphingomicrobium sp.]
MKNILLLAGATMLAMSIPAAAKPGNGNGHGNSGHATMMTHGNSGHAVTTHGKGQTAHSGHGLLSDRYGRRYALSEHGGCPPGLAKKNNGCLPPGQAKKLYSVGQRYNRNFGTNWTYNQIPDYLRSQYNLDQSDRYYYRNGYLYQVDPRTQLVEQVISALLH